MGTRNLTVVIKKAKPVIAQYGQWDGYPEGQGVVALRFLKNTNMEAFEKKLEKVRFKNADDALEIKLFLESVGSEDGMLNSEQAQEFNKRFPFFSRNHGADILNLIMDSKADDIMLKDDTLFAADSLFCEWAYVINLDTKQLEVYGWDNPEAGFENTFERLFETEEYKKDYLKEKEDNGYGIVKAVKAFDFANLPEEKEFIKMCDQYAEQ
jgi:hypothetical protein